MAETATEPVKRKQPPQLAQRTKPRLEAPWEDIKNAVAAGLPMGKVAKQFAEYHPKGWETLHELIRKRASREGWLVPVTAMAKARERMEQAGLDVTGLSQMTPPTLRDPEKTGTLLVQSLSEMGEEGSILAGRLSLDLLKQAASHPERIAPIVDSKDIACNIKTLRLVAGMDKQGPVVSLNLWNGPTMSQPVPVTELGDTLNIRLDGGEDQE